MPEVEILANADARKVLSNAGKSKGLPIQLHDNLVKKLSDVAGKVEPKGAGFYGIDLGQGYRALFTYTDDMKPVMLYVGDHKGYDAISAEINRNATVTRSNFLKETPEAIALDSRKAVRSLSLEGFRESFLKATDKESVLIKEAAELAEVTARGGRFMKGAKVAGKVGSKALKVIAVGIVVAEITTLTSTAEAATLDGRLPKEAMDEYKKILVGQAATAVDPTFVGGEIAVQAAFADWAKRYIKDPKLEAELRPTSLLEALGMPMPTVSETKRSEFYQSLPAKDDPGLPPDIRELVKAKQEIHTAVDALMHEKTGFWNALAQSGGATDEQLHPKQVKAIDDAQQRFNDLYAKKLESGAVEAWNNRASPAQQAPAQARRLPGAHQ